MKVVALISGGKDSCFNMMRCLDYGHEIVALANLLPADDLVDELDSYMYQTVGHQIVSAYAQCMGLPLFRRRIRGQSRAQDLRYTQTSGDEVEDLFILLKEVKNHFPDIQGVSSGAIASDYQRMRVENVCSRLGLVSLAFLWKQDQALLLQQMISRGIFAVIVKVAAIGLNPSNHLGKHLLEMRPLLTSLSRLFGINVCGEGGEYETLTLDCPLFKNYRIRLDKFTQVLHSPDTIASVGVLHPTEFHLEPKSTACSEDQVQMSFIQEVDGNPDEFLQKDTCDDNTKLPIIPSLDKSQEMICCSAQRTENFTVISCMLTSYVNSSGIDDELGFILASISDELAKDGLNWGNVLFIHMYINDMAAFALINQRYMKIIREELCVKGVPSRSTLGLALVNNGRGRIMVEIIASKNMDKNVLHVQSVSCWAPSCIGPYSQATLHNRLLYMAGQLGLDPPTMNLVSGSPAAQTKQALRNCEAVAQEFSASVVSDCLSLLIYCSDSLDFSQQHEVGGAIDNFLLPPEQKMSTEMQYSYLFPVAFVKVPTLPKGAVVEIEPFIYLPFVNVQDLYEEGNIEMERVAPNVSCQSSLVLGNVCRAFTFIPREGNPISTSLGEYLFKELNVSLEGFTNLLVRSQLGWKDVIALRVMFVSDIVSFDLAEESWNKAVNEAINTLGTNDLSLGSLKPLFIPVLSLGRNIKMDDLIMFDMLASK